MPTCLVFQLLLVVERAIIDERLSHEGASALFMAGDAILPGVRDTFLRMGSSF